MFLVLDGRQPGYSIGADLYDVQEILLKRGAVIAANLDGGSSSVLVKGDEIVNKPSSQYGERYLPTAFLVFQGSSCGIHSECVARAAAAGYRRFQVTTSQRGLGFG